MPNYRRAYTPGASYFFTVVSHARKPIFLQDQVRQALRAAIISTRIHYPFAIDAWVLLPDHMHCIWTLPNNDHQFSNRWGMIKRQVSQAWVCDGSLLHLSNSRNKRRESGLWQRRFWEHQIRDEDDFQHHIDYIHWNPVKHQYVSKVIDWPYSSFHRYVKTGLLPPNWGASFEDPGKCNFGE
ncbi:REP-associated tyrosine transposase [Undibacterium danionis]|uniref:Transposase n=1 Tax=Undibacterium danionis TaxID=1812100 RepID=A0ABV6ID77_9BURK